MSKEWYSFFGFYCSILLLILMMFFQCIFFYVLLSMPQSFAYQHVNLKTYHKHTQLETARLTTVIIIHQKGKKRVKYIQTRYFGDDTFTIILAFLLK